MFNPYVLLGALVGAILLAVVSFNAGVDHSDVRWAAKIEEQKKDAANMLLALKEEYREKERADAEQAIKADEYYQGEIAKLQARNAGDRSDLARRVRNYEKQGCGNGREPRMPSPGADPSRPSDPPTGGELGFYRINHEQLSVAGEGANRLAAWARTCFAQVNGVPAPVGVP